MLRPDDGRLDSYFDLYPGCPKDENIQGTAVQNTVLGDFSAFEMQHPWAAERIASTYMSRLGRTDHLRFVMIVRDPGAVATMRSNIR